MCDNLSLDDIVDSSGPERSERDLILCIETGDDLDEAMQFVGLDLVGLAMLLDGRYIDPDARPCRGPSAAECLSFLGRWPEVRAHGYALHPGREPDGGLVRIEGFECEMDEVAPERQGPLREAFRAHREADVFRDDEDRMFAWWG